MTAQKGQKKIIQRRSPKRMGGLSKFPEENPFPVLRLSADGTVLYSNAPGRALLDVWNCGVRKKAPKNWRVLVKETLCSKCSRTVEVSCGDRIYSVTIVPIIRTGYVNLYGLDITKQRQTELALQTSEQSVRRKLESILSPKADIAELELRDVIDVASVQSLMDDFYKLVHIPMAIIDMAGKTLVGVGWQDICTKFHRVNPITCRYCLESDLELSAGAKEGIFTLYKCKNNLWDAATPIIVGGKKMGNLFTGQFFFENEQPDYDFFRSQARQYGFDETEYLAALDKVPHLSREVVNRGMEFLHGLSRMISQSSYSNLNLARLLTERQTWVNSLRQSDERLRLALDAAESAPWEIDLVTQKVISSPRMAKIYGVDAAHLPQTRDQWRAFVIEEDRGFIQDTIDAAILGDGKHRLEFRIRRPDGAIRCILSEGQIYKDEQGRPCRMAGLLTDITERKQAEEAVKVSGVRYRRLFEAARNGILILDADSGAIVDVNPFIKEMLGYSHEEFLGKKLWDIGLFKNIAASKEAFRKLQNKEYIRFENIPLETKDGRRIAVEFVSNVYRVDQKKVIQCNIRDITDRVQAEEALRRAHDELEERVKQRTADLAQTVAALENEVRRRITAEATIKAERKRFEDVLEMMPAYAILLTPDYHVAYANRTFREWFGDHNGKKCYEFLFNRSEPCEDCQTYNVIKTGKSQFWEWTGPNGRNYDIYDYPFTDTDDSPLIMEIGVDVTAHKQAQKALRSASLYTRTLIEASLDPLVTIDPKGKITDVNKATETATGLQRASLINTDFSDYFTEPDKARQGYKKVLSEGQVRDYPLTIWHLSGRAIDVLYNATVYQNEAGEMQGVFAAARDVTERNRAEARIQFTNVLLELFTKKASRKEYLDSVVGHIHAWSGCRCVGIRLTDGDGCIPYESSVGFSGEFLATENRLSLKTDNCLCIRAITQRAQLSDTPLVTQRGSFCSGDTIAFLAALSDEEKSRYRGTCMRHGFASLAVIPIRYRDQIVGAIHLADERQNQTPSMMVEFLEHTAMLIGEAIHRFDVEKAMRLNRDRLLEAQRIAHLGNWEWDIRGGQLFWSDEVYRIFGLKPHQVVATYAAFLACVHPDDRKFVEESIAAALKGEKEYSIDHRIIRPDGCERIVREMSEITYDAQRKPVKMVGTVHDVTEQRQAERAIRESQKALRSLSAQLQLAEERERRRIAQDLHDSVGQLLAFSSMELNSLQQSAPLSLMQSLKTISAHLAEAVKQTRTLSFDLSPSILYDLGFEVAVEDLVQRFSRERNIPCHFENCKQSKPLREDVKVLLYRSVRELLINAAKHAMPETIKVLLLRSGLDIYVIVEDDGQGFDASSLESDSRKTEGFGLLSIRERLNHIGGRLKIESVAGKGTKAVLVAPLNAETEESENQ